MAEKLEPKDTGSIIQTGEFEYIQQGLLGEYSIRLDSEPIGIIPDRFPRLFNPLDPRLQSGQVIKVDEWQGVYVKKVERINPPHSTRIWYINAPPIESLLDLKGIGDEGLLELLRNQSKTVYPSNKIEPGPAFAANITDNDLVPDFEKGDKSKLDNFGDRNANIYLAYLLVAGEFSDKFPTTEAFRAYVEEKGGRVDFSHLDLGLAMLASRTMVDTLKEKGLLPDGSVHKFYSKLSRVQLAVAEHLTLNHNPRDLYSFYLHNPYQNWYTSRDLPYPNYLPYAFETGYRYYLGLPDMIKEGYSFHIGSMQGAIQVSLNDLSRRTLGYNLMVSLGEIPHPDKIIVMDEKRYAGLLARAEQRDDLHRLVTETDRAREEVEPYAVNLHIL